MSPPGFQPTHPCKIKDRFLMFSVKLYLRSTTRQPVSWYESQRSLHSELGGAKGRCLLFTHCLIMEALGFLGLFLAALVGKFHSSVFA